MTGSVLGPLDYMFSETLRVAVMTSICAAGLVAIAARVRHWSLERAARIWLLISSVAAIWLFTQHNPYGGTGRVLDLNPLGDLKVAAQTTGRYRDIVLANVALFVPFGVALAWRGTRFFRTLGLAFLMSTAAEVTQYVMAHGRVAQTGDVITNITGALVGWCVFVALTGGWGPLTRREKRTQARGFPDQQAA